MDRTLRGCLRVCYNLSLSVCSFTNMLSYSDDSLVRQIAGAVFDYIFHGEPREIGSADGERLVEYGVARFGRTGTIIADEPLALLAAVDWFSEETDWKLQHFLVKALCTQNSSARGVAFEKFGAYLLALAFGTPQPLSTVFDFLGDCTIKDKEAVLVSAHRDKEGKLVWHPINITRNEWPTYRLGKSPHSQAASLSWIQNPDHSVFCFPDNYLGPDLVLLLQLSDGNLLRVVIQFKHLSDSTIGPKDTEDAFKTTDPDQFLSRNTTKKMQKKVKKALRNLGPKVPEAGDLSVLRVVMSYPAKPNHKTLTQLALEDSSHHLAATVDVEKLAHRFNQRDIVDTMHRRMVEAAQSKAENRSIMDKLMAED
jgi:hypothetical protein